MNPIRVYTLSHEGFLGGNGMELREIRRGRGYTQTKLSELSGVSQGKISEYENGMTTPRIDAAVKLAAALEITLDELVGAQLRAAQGNDEP